jgi:ABC-type phosphate transport system substrate-binding protein
MRTNISARSLALAIAVVAMVAWPGRITAQDGFDFHVIVHPDNPVTSITRNELSQIFFKRTTRWEDGTRALPVDLFRSSPLRDVFSRTVMNRAADAIAAHWQQQIFSGRGVPPTELGSEFYVVQYVRDHPGAIGYVAKETDVSGVRILEIRP